MPRPQHTIKRTVSASGIGLHTGKKASVRFKPAKAGSGVVFVRTDLPGRPGVKAVLKNVTSTVRGTNLGSIHTIEHILSALYAFSVDNLEIEMDGPEPPVLDGSSRSFCDMIARAGIIPQGAKARRIDIVEPVFALAEGKSIVALPSDGFTVSFMIDYTLDFIGAQFYRFEFSGNRYAREIAPARTYGFMDELSSLKEQGLALGASSKCAVAIGRDRYLTRLRFGNELVRHKILDLIGDLSLLGAEINGHIICVRSGHDLNIRFAKELSLQ